MASRIVVKPFEGDPDSVNWREEYEALLKRVADVASEQADERDWCDDYLEFVNDVDPRLAKGRTQHVTKAKIEIEFEWTSHSELTNWDIAQFCSDIVGANEAMIEQNSVYVARKAKRVLNIDKDVQVIFA